MGGRQPAGVGPADRAGPPRASTSRAATRWSWPIAAGPAWAGAASRRARSSRTLEAEGSRTCALPAVPERPSSSTRRWAGCSPPGWPAGRRSIARIWPTPTASCALRDLRARSTDGSASRGDESVPPMSQRPIPTLAELRGRVQKGRHREIGNWLARTGRAGRRRSTGPGWRSGSGSRPTRSRWPPWSPASAARGRRSAPGLAPGFVVGRRAGAPGFWLDHVDGQVARWRGTVEPRRRLPRLPDAPRRRTWRWASRSGYGLAARTGRPALGGRRVRDRAGLGVSSLHNDCRYKAFFQRLKSDDRDATASMAAAAAGPRPPPPWPRRGLGRSPGRPTRRASRTSSCSA